MDNLESDLKRLIVSSLQLEDLAAEDIGDDEALFGNAGLALDSIDALELGVAIRKAYGVKISGETENVAAHFASVRALAAFIRAQRAAEC